MPRRKPQLFKYLIFNTNCIHEARRSFCELRKKFDFPYWAIKEYYIRDRNNADNIIPLKLNTVQNYLIDILQKCYHNRQPSRKAVIYGSPLHEEKCCMHHQLCCKRRYNTLYSNYLHNQTITYG